MSKRAIVATLVCAACAGEPAPPPARVDQPPAAPVEGDPSLPAAPAAPPRAARAAGEPLDSTDFVVAGLVAGVDSGGVRRTLGRPDSVQARENAFNPDGQLITWHYRDLAISYADSPESFGFQLTGPRHATRRGARVGDHAQRIRQLYGKPADGYDQNWDYVDRTDPSERHVIRFTLEGDTVARIFVGWLLD